MRPPGHERSAWAVEAFLAQALITSAMAEGAIVTAVRPTNVSDAIGRFAGLRFRAAEVVYDAVQEGEARVRRIRLRIARECALAINESTQGTLARALRFFEDGP